MAAPFSPGIPGVWIYTGEPQFSKPMFFTVDTALKGDKAENASRRFATTLAWIQAELEKEAPTMVTSIDHQWSEGAYTCTLVIERRDDSA